MLILAGISNQSVVTAQTRDFGASLDGVYQSACPTPRPPIRVDVNPQGDGRIRVTLTAGSGALTLVKFGQMGNAHVIITGTGQQFNSHQEVKPPTGATTFTFDVILTAGVQTGQTPPATTVPMTIFDGCGLDQPWNTFVGGGATVNQSTASISDTDVSEGNTGNTQVTFTIKLSVPSSQPVTYTYNTSSGSAASPTDFVAASGTVTFNPGETTKTVTVQVRGDFDDESDETFTITLSNPINGGLGRATATARIVNDDDGPSASGDTYVASIGQQLTVAAPGLLSNDQNGSQPIQVVSFGGLDAGGAVDSNAAGSTRTLAPGGSLTVRANGSFDFTPPTNAGATFSFRYRAESLSGQSEATVIVNIQTGPTANADPNYVAIASTPLNVPEATGVLANDTRGTPQANVASFGTASPTTTPAGTLLDLGNGGSLTVQANGSFAFVAPSTVTGPFTFQYRLTNPAGSSDATVTITVARGPVITTTSGSSAYTEGSPAVMVDPGLTITNPSGGNVTSATAVITNPQDGAAELLAATALPGGIVPGYVAATHTLTLTGPASAADFQTALRGVTYINTSEAPNATARTVQFEGIANGQNGNQATKSVTVAAVNDDPVLSGIEGAPLTYTENDPATPITATISIVDLDHPNLAGATIGLAGGTCVAAEDLLSFTTQNGISGVYTPATCTMVLTGSSSIANYQTALRSVGYSNSSNAPSVTPRTVGFQVTDGVIGSNVVSRTINVTSVNDLPVVTTTPGATAFTEGAGAVTIDGGVTVTDGDHLSLASATVTITNLLDAGQETLAANVAGTSITAGYAPATGILTLSGTDTLTNYELVLRSVTYNNASVSPTLTNRTVAFVANDSVGNSATANRTVSLTAVNSAPVVTTTGGVSAFFEDSTPAQVDTLLTVTDPDSANLVSATVTITNLLDAGLETLAANVAGTSITPSYAPATGILTLSGTDTLANYEQVLRSVTYENTSNNPTTAPNRVIRFQVNDGAVASNQADKSVSITANNDLPVVTTTAGTTVFTEGAGAVTIDGGVTVIDVDNTTLASATVTITNLLDAGQETLAANVAGTAITPSYAPATGILTLSGVDSLANYQLVLRSVTYNNASIAPNLTNRAISFVANDGVGNSAAAFRAVSITAVNSAPIVTTSGGVTAYTENGPAAVVDSLVTVTDADSATMLSATVTITNIQDAGLETLAANVAGTSINQSYAPATGILTLSGSDTRANYEQVLRTITYANSSNTPTTPPDRVISFLVNDGVIDSNTATKSVSVAAFDDPPTAVNDAATVFEDAGATAVDVLANDTDVDSGPKSISSVTQPANGAVVITGGGTGLNYQPDADYCNNGSPLDTFTYTLNGGSPATVSVTVTCVNDAPSFVMGPNQGPVDNQDGAGAPVVRTVNNWATSISKGPANEAGQNLTFNVSVPLAQQALFTTQPAISATGTLTYTPDPAQAGTATVTVTLSDDGGVLNGGVDTFTPASPTFTIQTVFPAPDAVDDGPSADYTANGGIPIDIPASIGVTDNDIVRGASISGYGAAIGTEQTTIGATTPTAQGGTVSLNADGSFRYTPPCSVPGGSDSFKYRLTNPGGSDIATVTITVNAGVCFVAHSAAAGGDGSITKPFQQLDDVPASRPVSGAVYVLFGTGGLYDAAITLKNGESLLGQAVPASGNLPFALAPRSDTAVLPAAGSTPVLTVASGSLITLAQNNALEGFNIGNVSATGTGVTGSNFGTLNITTVSISTNGRALNLETGTVNNGAISSITSTGGANNVRLNAVATSGAAFNLGSGALSGATGDALAISGGGGSLNYSGSIASGSARSVNISGKTGGTVALSGAVTDTDTGISLTSNTGSTITFTNTLTINTGSNAGFTATGGGTVTATNSANTIATTTGTALNVANTTIGATGLTFRSISANGGTNGIVLNTTGSSGGLTVTGNSAGLCGGAVGAGPPAAAATTTAPISADCTGGTIQNTTGAAILLSNTSNVSLTRMWVKDGDNDGIQGTNVTNFTLASSLVENNGNALNENNIDFGDSSSLTPDGLHGTAAISSSTIRGGYNRNLVVRNTGGTALTAFTVTDSQFTNNPTNNDGDDGILIEAGGTASMAISVTDSYFASNKGDHFQAAALNSGSQNVTFTNNTLVGGHTLALGQGVTINAATGVAFGGYTGDITYDINGNNFTGAISNSVSVVLGTSASTASFVGKVRNNVIGASGDSLSCSTSANGVYIDARGNGTHTSQVNNNIIRQCFDRGILAEAGDGDSVLNLTVTGNTIDQQVDPSARESIQTNFGITSTNVFGNVDSNTVCLQVGGAGALANIFSHGAGAPDDFRLRKRQEATVRLPGYGGGTGQDAGSLAQVVAFIQGQNTGSAGEPGSASASGAGGGYTGGAGCATPP